MRYQAWQYLSRYPNDLLEEIIKLRKIENREDFLQADYKKLSATDVLVGLEKAKKRILEAIENAQAIGIFCDYDADGVCSGAIIYKALKQLKAERVVYYVPDRSEGYSLNTNAIDFFIQSKVSLVITLDCGIKNHNEISQLSKSGIDTIIVDHHLLPDELPEAVAIVHPDLTTDGSSLELSGGGTAYMLARSLLGFSGQEKWLIDLAAVSSVADVVPLNHDNRILVKYGMTVLEKTKNIGFKSLLDICGLNQKKLSTYELGFMIGPRLNAAGRVAHPKDSFELLISDDQIKAKALAKKLDDFNKTRQDLLSRGIEEAEKLVDEGDLSKKNIIILRGDWDEGIVGLISSKITDRFYRPSIVFSNKSGFVKGSARSIGGINITTLIEKVSKYLISFGGHSQAAGLSVSEDRYNEFEKLILKEAKSIDKACFIRELKVDALVKLKDLNIKNISNLEKLAPFGPGNPKPVLALESVIITGSELIGSDKSHMKLYFESEELPGCCLIFSYAKKKHPLETNTKVDIAFTPCLNHFNGKTKVDLMIEDVKEAR